MSSEETVLGSWRIQDSDKNDTYPICNLFGFRQSHFSNVSYYYCYIPTTCFGPYGPSSDGIYILITSQGAIFLQRFRCSCFGYQLCVCVCVYIYIYIYIYKFLVLAIFRRCQYVCGGYDCLLLLLHFSILSYYVY
jgi:hypothetical protein